jgi:hypothetical protein
MRTAELKLQLYRLIDSTNDESLLKKLYNSLSKTISKKDVDFWKEFSEEQKLEILASIEESRKKHTTSHKQIEKKYKKWF